MAEYGDIGDTLEKIAADEIARLQQIPEVMKLFPDKATAKARGEKMLEQLDKEIFGRRDAVNKRLKITLQRELHAAKEEQRPPKKYHKATLGDNEDNEDMRTMSTSVTNPSRTRHSLGASFAIQSRRRSGTIYLPLTRWWSRQLLTQSH